MHYKDSSRPSPRHGAGAGFLPLRVSSIALYLRAHAHDQLNSALYQASATGTLKSPATLTFHYAENGLDVVKTFTFGSDYVIHADVQVRRNGQPVRTLLAWPAGLGDQEEFQGRSRIPGLTRTPATFDWCLDDKSDSEAAGKVGNDATLEGDYQYAAAADLYFAAAFLPDYPSQATVVTLHKTIDLPVNLSNPNGEKKPADVMGVAVGDVSGDDRLRLYVGPKQTGPDIQPFTLRVLTASPTAPTCARSSASACRTFLATPLFWILRLTAYPRHPQLGMGHHRPHRHLQPRPAAHPAHDDEVVAEDDAHPAQGGGAQAQIPAVQSY